MKSIATKRIIISGAALFCSAMALAQEPVGPTNHVNLSATASVEVPQDWLSMQLSAMREGADPAAVQSQLKSALDAALSLSRSVQEKERLEVRTGNFSLAPRYSREGKINGWQGSTELTIEGRDFERIATLAGKIQTMNLQNVQFSLSPAARTKLESDLQAQAIARFKGKAQDVSSSFGFTGYQVVQITVGSTDGGGSQPRPVMAMAAKAAFADSAVPVEAGRSTVQLTVSGTVRMK